MATDLLTAESESRTAVSVPSGDELNGQTVRTPGEATGLDGQMAMEIQPLSRMHHLASTDVNAVLKDLIQLTKPRIVVMILVTTVATAMIAAGGTVALPTMFLLLLGTGLTERAALHRNLTHALPQIDKLPSARQVRWHCDIDPSDTY